MEGIERSIDGSIDVTAIESVLTSPIRSKIERTDRGEITLHFGVHEGKLLEIGVDQGVQGERVVHAKRVRHEVGLDRVFAIPLVLTARLFGAASRAVASIGRRI